jgi:hypothetical protein
MKREMTIINEILKNNEYQQLPTNFQHQNKVSVNFTQTLLNTQTEKNQKGPPSRILDQKIRVEPAPTYFEIQTLKVCRRQLTQSNII